MARPSAIYPHTIIGGGMFFYKPIFVRVVMHFKFLCRALTILEQQTTLIHHETASAMLLMVA